MTIGILDLDYYHAKISPNPDCMKISSFHHQMADTVILITEKQELTRNFDILYITRNQETTPNAPVRLLTAKNTRIFGNAMELFINWEIPSYISACRPDYILYPEKNNKLQRSDLLQLANEKGQILPLIQDIENAYTNKKTLVVDKHFWEMSEKNIIKGLKRLQAYKNVAFFHPIWLKPIKDNKLIRKLFLEQNYKKESWFKFKNDIGDDYESAQWVADLLKDLKRHAPTSSVGYVNFAPVTKDHLISEDNAWYDLERCFKIIELGKSNGIQLRLQHDAVITPYSPLFQLLIQWTDKAYTLSFMEFIAQPLARRRHCNIVDIYMDAKYWSDQNFIGILHVLQQKPDWVSKYCLRKWKNTFFAITKLNLAELERTIR